MKYGKRNSVSDSDEFYIYKQNYQLEAQKVMKSEQETLKAEVAALKKKLEATQQ